jgi:hypothetical protein
MVMPPPRWRKMVVAPKPGGQPEQQHQQHQQLNVRLLQPLGQGSYKQHQR